MPSGDDPLAGTPLFDGVPANFIRQCRALMIERQVARDDIIFRQEDVGSDAFIIRSGAMRVERLHEDGHRFLFTIMGPGDVAGEIGLLTGNPRLAQIAAQTDSVILTFSRADFDAMTALHALMAQNLTRIVCARLIGTNLKLERVGLMPLEARLAHVVLDLARRFGAAGRIGLNLTQGDLAELVIASREKTNRVLKTWEKAGIMRFGRADIVVQDADHLALIARNEAV